MNSFGFVYKNKRSDVINFKGCWDWISKGAANKSRTRHLIKASSAAVAVHLENAAQRHNEPSFVFFRIGEKGVEKRERKSAAATPTRSVCMTLAQSLM